jgi:hypothetical protein
MKVIFNIPQTDIDFIRQQSAKNHTNFTIELTRCIETLRFLDTYKFFGINLLVEHSGKLNVINNP